MAKKRKKDNIDLICEELTKYNEQHGTSYSYGEYTALVGMGKIKSKYRNKRDIDLNFAGAEDRLLTGQMKRRVKIMKKGTTVESGYDAEGRWHLKLRKAKGKFTLDEIIEAAKEWEEDYYAVIIKAMSDETAQYYDDDLEGDYVTLYRATDFISKEV